MQHNLSQIHFLLGMELPRMYLATPFSFTDYIFNWGRVELIFQTLPCKWMFYITLHYIKCDIRRIVTFQLLIMYYAVVPVLSLQLLALLMKMIKCNPHTTVTPELWTPTEAALFNQLPRNLSGDYVGHLDHCAKYGACMGYVCGSRCNVMKNMLVFIYLFIRLFIYAHFFGIHLYVRPFIA